jgi:hypothetical protein
MYLWPKQIGAAFARALRKLRHYLISSIRQSSVCRTRGLPVKKIFVVVLFWQFAHASRLLTEIFGLHCLHVECASVSLQDSAKPP